METAVLVDACAAADMDGNDVSAIISRGAQIMVDLRASQHVGAWPAWRECRALGSHGAQNSKHSIRLPTAASPSPGGAGGPVGWPLEASLFGPPGVDRSNWWLMEARVGSPNTASRNFRVEVCS